MGGISFLHSLAIVLSLSLPMKSSPFWEDSSFRDNYSVKSEELHLGDTGRLIGTFLVRACSSGSDFYGIRFMASNL